MDNKQKDYGWHLHLEHSKRHILNDNYVISSLYNNHDILRLCDANIQHLIQQVITSVVHGKHYIIRLCNNIFVEAKQ